MSKLTKYTLNNYIKAIGILARNKFAKFEHFAKRGSIYCFRLYEKENDSEPGQIWIIHHHHSKKKEIYSRDLEKAWIKLGVTEKDFLSVINTL